MSKMSDAYRVDPELESKTGVRLEFQGPCWITMKRAGGNNRAYQRAIQELTKPVRRQITNETIDPDKLNEIYIRAYARAVVLGWEEVTDLEDNALAYSEANFLKAMQLYPDLWEDVQREATKLTNFRKETNGEDGEELGNSSFGISSGVQH